MQPSFSVGNDFLQVVDGLEPVRLRRPGAAGERLLASAKRRAVQVREAEASGGQYRAGDVHWHLHRAELPTPPALGWQIIDRSGAAWTILAVDQSSHDTRWRCHCRNLAVAAGLDAHVTLQIASWSKDAAGAAVARWSDWRSGIPARLQPAQAERHDGQHRQTSIRSYRVIVGLDDVLDDLARYRVVGPDGSMYRIASYERAERIDALPVLIVEEWRA